MRRLISSFLNDDRGNVAMIFGLAAIPLIGVTGIAVDYTRASHFRAILQSTVDASALAGATETSNGAATGTISAFMNATLPGGLSTNDVSYTLDLQPDAITISAKATVPTTIAAIFRNEMPVSASATASRGAPVRLVDLSVTNFNSDAADANSIYWYIIPKDGGLPADADLHLLLSNDPAHPASAVPDSIQIGVDDRIGFALINVTGGVHPYGNNSYEQAVGSVHKFYSQQPPENLREAGNADCSYGTVEHAWDDNGGVSDDNDYNDAVYDFACTTVQTDPKTVLLIR
jgi:Flp pilus assembly protein TadG